MAAITNKSSEFHEKREACIRSKYNADEIGQRIHNGDGLLPYNKRGIEILESGKRIIYKGMGVHKCSRGTEKRRKGKPLCRHNERKCTVN